MKLGWVFIIITALILGCATPPKGSLSFDDANIGNPNANQSVLVLYRVAVLPLAFTVTANMDGKKLAQLPNESFTWAYMSPGKHEIKMTWPFLAGTPSSKITVNAEAGNYYFVKFVGHVVTGSPSPGKVLSRFPFNVQDLHLSSNQKYMEEVRSCCLYVPASF